MAKNRRKNVSLVLVWDKTPDFTHLQKSLFYAGLIRIFGNSTLMISSQARYDHFDTLPYSVFHPENLGQIFG